MASRSLDHPVTEADLAAFFAANLDRSRRLAYRLLGGNTALAEDVVQDAFVDAMRGVRHFRGESSLDTWFYRVLVRRAQRQLRWSALRWRWSEPDADPADIADRTDDGDVLLRSRLRRAVLRLRGPQRTVFVLIHLEGFTVQESAALLERSAGTVKTHLHRALVKLRDELGDVFEGSAATACNDSERRQPRIAMEEDGHD